MTPCPQLTPLLAARPRGLLGEEAVCDLEGHLRACSTCRLRAEQVEGWIPSPPASPTDAVWDRLAARIGQDMAQARVAARIALSCSFCHDSLPSNGAVYCASCLAPHHPECFQDHARCSVLGCEETRTVQPSSSAPPRPRRSRWPWLLGGGLLVAAAFSIQTLGLTDEVRATRHAPSNPIQAKVAQVRLRELQAEVRFQERAARRAVLAEEAGAGTRSEVITASLILAEARLELASASGRPSAVLAHLRAIVQLAGEEVGALQSTRVADTRSIQEARRRHRRWKIRLAEAELLAESSSQAKTSAR